MVYPTGNIQFYKGCGVTKKPDILYFADDTLCIIEVDEHGHSSYDSSCEKARIIEILSAALCDDDVRFVKVLRFNPDSCRDWSINQYPLEKRLRALVEEIKSIPNHTANNSHPFIIKYLYYNGKKQNEAITDNDISQWIKGKFIYLLIRCNGCKLIDL